MKAVTSVSGGKTSCMMALEFPTDYYVFAVVLIDHPNSAPKDPGLLRECQHRLPGFVASAEADLTLLNILRLEQEIGKEIKWLASEYSLDRFMAGTTDLPGYRAKSPMLPNKRTRFCTVQTKLNPIFWHCYLNYFDGDPIFMNIGLRVDEPNRVDNWTCDNDKYRYAAACHLASKKYRWNCVDWRVSQFPMHENHIDSLDVAKYWLNKGWQFPEVSNCRFCFHHRDLQQQRQAELEPENLTWWLDWEQRTGKTFGDRALADILRQPLLNVFDDAPCHCTD